MIIHNSDGSTYLTVEVDDTSYRHRAIMGDNNLTLYFALAEYKEIPVGSYVEFQGEKYTLLRPQNIKMQHTRNFEYTVLFESQQANLKLWKFRNTVDGRLKFPLTAKPQEHLKMLVDNLNMSNRDSGWKVGDYIESAEKLISYDHAYCLDALSQMADTFETEFYIDSANKRISLGKVEGSKSDALALSYGQGKGFQSGLGRSNYGDNPPIETLYVQGGSDNIDKSKYTFTKDGEEYHSGELLLPENGAIWYDGETFYDEQPADNDNAHKYVVSADRLSIRRSDMATTTKAEESLDCTHIYPKYVGTIESVIVADEENNFYDFTDANSPDYSDCIIAGETMTVIFQSGELAGREFNISDYSYDKVSKVSTFKIQPQELDGVPMPSGSFVPKGTVTDGKGDTYAIFHVSLPDDYIKMAEVEMLKEAVKYLYEHEQTAFSFTGTLDGLWAKKDWENIGGKIALGKWVSFTQDKLQDEPILVRIIGIKDYVNNPHSPEIELSNTSVSTSFSTTLQTIESQEVKIEQSHKDALQFTRRTWRSAKETMDAIEKLAKQLGYSDAIKPIVVNTMTMLVGDESLQFEFFGMGSRDYLDPRFENGKVVISSERNQIDELRHYTLGMNEITSEADYNMSWNIDSIPWESGTLDADSQYYLYIQCDKTDETKTNWYLSKTPISRDSVSGVYSFLVGIFTSEQDGQRDFMTLHGFTEVSPGRVTTDRIVATGGESYFDLVKNAFHLGSKNSKYGLGFNEKGDGVLALRGVLVQSLDGDARGSIGVYRGKYNATYTYYDGDEVTYELSDGSVVTYRCVASSGIKGALPTDTNNWEVVAVGAHGEQGNKGEDGKTVNPNLLLQTVFASAEQMTKWDIRTGTIYKSMLNGYNAYYGNNTSSSTYKNLLRQQINSVIEGGKWYTLSFYLKRGQTINGGVMTTFVHTGTNNVFVVDTSAGCIVDGVKQTYVNEDGSQDWDMSEEWKKHSYTFKTLETLNVSANDYITFRLSKYTDTRNNAYIAMVKLEEGTEPTAYIPNMSDLGQIYYEYRYAVNNTPTSAPSLSNTSEAPSGWSTTQPTVSSGYYLWQIYTRKYPDGSLVQNWSTPIRVSPKDGAKGSSPALVFRGKYDDTKTYYGNPNRVDCVYMNTDDGIRYFVTRTDLPDGEIFKEPPWQGELEDDYWREFGASLESVATALLLAEMANIAGFIFKNNQLISQKGTIDGVDSEDYGNEKFVPNLIIDGVTGTVTSADGAVMDKYGISLYNDGKPVGRFVSSSIGKEVDLELLSATGKKFSYESTDSVKLESGATNSYNWCVQEQTIGYLTEGSRIRVGTWSIKVTLPSPSSSSSIATLVYSAITAKIEILCNGKTVESKTGTLINSPKENTAYSLNMTNMQQSAVEIDNKTLYKEGLYSVRIFLQVTCSAVNSSGKTTGGTLNDVIYSNYMYLTYKKANINKTLIGSDGMYSCWGAGKYFFGNADGITLRMGNNLIRVTDDAIISQKKDANGNTITTNL